MENTNSYQGANHSGTPGNDQQNKPLQKAGEVAGEMKQEVDKYVDSAKHYWDEFSTGLEEKGKIAREGLNKATKYANEYAHEHPWKLIGIAAAVGALAALAITSCGSCNCRRHAAKE